MGGRCAIIQSFSDDWMPQQISALSRQFIYPSTQMKNWKNSTVMGSTQQAMTNTHGWDCYAVVTCETRGSAIAEEPRDALRQLKYYGRFLAELLTSSSANPEEPCEHTVSWNRVAIILHKCSTDCIWKRLQAVNDLQSHSRSLPLPPFDRPYTISYLSLIHIWRCRRSYACRSRWSPYH